MRAIAFHLPQFHPIKENDQWWGKGFTEWTNVVRSRPLFKGHYQPHLPADLGFYDLRLAESRAAQAALASAYGVYGFCYYHYWFGGKRLLERPVNEILSSGQPDFPFCLCWANENWSRRWDGMDREILVEQTYSAEDDQRHFDALAPAFFDPRYIREQGKPVFLIYRSTAIPDSRATTDRWRAAAEKAGLPGLYLIRVESQNERVPPAAHGFDAALEFQPFSQAFAAARVYRKNWWEWQRLGTGKKLYRDHQICSYPKLVEAALSTPWPDYPWIRSVCPSWDNSPRRKTGGVIFTDSTPAMFRKWVANVGAQARERSEPGEAPMMFVNAWNEWAEGTHLEPCLRWGLQYLEALRDGLRDEHPQARAAPVAQPD